MKYISLSILSCLSFCLLLNFSSCKKQIIKPKKFAKICCEEAELAACLDELCINAPNVFVPNGNSYNEVFYIHSNQKNGNYSASLVIFDKNGDVVFENQSMPYNDPSAGWDGQDADGIVSQNVYTYQLTVTASNQQSQTFNKTIYVRTGASLSCIDNRYNCVYSTQYDGGESFDPGFPSLEVHDECD